MMIRKEQADQFKKAQEFYSSVEYYAQIQTEDIVFSAYDNDSIIGVVRLAPENDVLVLRGMMITPNQQRKGIGSQMLKAIEPEIGNQGCFCLPHDWLEGFYGQIGFRKVDDDFAPAHLYERLIENRKKYPKLIMMKRDGSVQ